VTADSVFAPLAVAPSERPSRIHRLRQLAAESAVYGLSGMIASAIGVLFTPIYTRLFLPEDYGVLSIVSTSMGVISVLVILGLDSASSRYYWDVDDPSARKATLASWAWCQIALSSVAGLAIIVGSPWLAAVLVGRADAAVYYRLMAATLPLNTLVVVTTALLRMQRRPWATMTFSLATSIAQIALTLLFVVGLRWGLFGNFLGQATSIVIGFVASVVLLRDWVNPRHVRLARLRPMLRFGLPLVPASLGIWVISYADRYFVQRYTNLAEVGLFSVGASLAAVVALATAAFQLAWGPFAMSIHREPDARQTYADVFLGYVWLGCFLATGLALFAPEILRVVTTPRYVGASNVAGMLTFSHVMIGLGSVGALGPYLTKRTVSTGAAITAGAIVNVALNFAFVPHFGKEGAAAATLISQSVWPIYLLYRSQKMYPVPYRFTAALALGVLALAVCVVGRSVSATSPWAVAALKALLLLVFASTLFSLRMLPRAGALARARL
jgi:O-antigen/teichoic acid export membrane protein